VQAAGVVPVDPGEHVEAGLGAGGVTAPVDPLDLQRGEERFGRGVVETDPGTTDRAAHAEGLARPGEVAGGEQYTSWAFGRRLRAAGLLGSMGSIGDCFDNSVVESFFGTLQLELLDEHRWDTRQQLALAIFDWIEAWYNPRRRHSYCAMLSPIDYERAHIPAAAAA
jgi:transposase InsO family protein